MCKHKKTIKTGDITCKNQKKINLTKYEVFKFQSYDFLLHFLYKLLVGSGSELPVRYQYYFKFGFGKKTVLDGSQIGIGNNLSSISDSDTGPVF